jgi:chorismate synthase
MQHDLRLDARIAGSVMAIQAIKGVEIGLGFESAKAPGSQVHDPIHHSADASGPAFGFTRGKNNAGGIEGGITNGMPVVVRAAMKPIPTLIKPLASVDMSKGMAPAEAMYERSDVCAVPAASVVVECVVAFEIARVLIEKLGGDTLEEMKANYENYRRLVIKALGI